MHLLTQLVAVFLALLPLCCSQRFSDTQLFVDFSTYNFYMGKSFVIDRILTARPGKQVHLYLFQNNYQQYSIEVRDGSQTYDKVIPVQSFIPSNDQLLTLPVPIISSGESMRVTITADNTNSTGIADFQALATDFVQPDSCSNMIISVNKRDSNVEGYNFPVDPKSDCYYVIHANDPTNNPALIQSVKTSLSSDSFTIYKGLQTDSEHILQHDELMSSVSASDKYLVVRPKKEISLTFGSTFEKNLDQTIVVAPRTHGSIMSNDYYQDNYPDIAGALSQTFTLIKSNGASSIQVSYMKIMGAGSLTVTAYSNNKQVGKPSIFSSTLNGVLTLNYDCDKLVLKYSTPSRPKTGLSGFYAVYADGATPLKN